MSSSFRNATIPMGSRLVGELIHRMYMQRVFWSENGDEHHLDRMFAIFEAVTARHMDVCDDCGVLLLPGGGRVVWGRAAHAQCEIVYCPTCKGTVAELHSMVRRSCIPAINLELKNGKCVNGLPTLKNGLSRYDKDVIVAMEEMMPSGAWKMTMSEPFVFEPKATPVYEQSPEEFKFNKTMTRILRHQAHKLGIAMDSEGWVSVAELIGKSYVGATSEKIRKMVKNDDKRRFALRITASGRTEIRAVNGHTLGLQLGKGKWDPIANNVLIGIHCTKRKHVADIMEQGLKRMKRDAVHMFDYAKPDVWKSRMPKGSDVGILVDLRAAKDANLEFAKMDNDVLYCYGDMGGTINPEFISSVVGLL